MKVVLTSEGSDETLAGCSRYAASASYKRRWKTFFPTRSFTGRSWDFPPLGGWLAGAQLDSIEELLLEPRSMNRRFFERADVERLFGEHRSHYSDRYDRIWRLFNLELWHRVCLEGESHEWTPTCTSKIASHRVRAVIRSSARGPVFTFRARLPPCEFVWRGAR